jgi:5-formyltetrahydrofolate cyclo-ligase
MQNKSKKIRKEKLTARDQLTAKDLLQNSRNICEQVMDITDFKKSKIVFIYVDFRSEVKTRELINIMFEMGKQVVVPVTLLAERDLLPVYINNLTIDLAPGYASIPEPVESIRQTQRVAPESIDLIFLPGSVFDEQGGRMGYGGGFYDRFVSVKAPQAFRVGLAYEVQMVERAPLRDHDEYMDMVITEKRVIHTTR